RRCIHRTRRGVPRLRCADSGHRPDRGWGAEPRAIAADRRSRRLKPRDRASRALCRRRSGAGRSVSLAAMNPMQSNTRVTLHVGLPKCASTFLQAHVFSRHPDVQFLGIFRPVHETDDEGIESMLGAPIYDYLMALKTEESIVFDQGRLDA